MHNFICKKLLKLIFFDKMVKELLKNFYCYKSIENDSKNE